MTTSPIHRGRSAGSAVLTAVVIAGDVALAVISLLAWQLEGGAEAATFALAGISAVAGAVLLLFAVAGFARGAAGPARLSHALAWARFAAVLLVLTVFAVRPGPDALIGFPATFGAAVAVVDALAAVLVTRAAVRRTADG
ncbi:hypothetical protein Ade02nite_72460 [Paractinoplanes deccanensis]|uniref:Uncharacterized protein n=1 Tax=Paractinoplanes deccanensis TaxID=113561 RepID=A0ABQ3YF27_9ACTN|nr:hypothetical protein [Actinoplanes deccanensis]GID78605.1 hypothetical protein Ade02nite_72460 [Actinoplanes deccanensis]